MLCCLTSNQETASAYAKSGINTQALPSRAVVLALPLHAVDKSSFIQIELYLYLVPNTSYKSFCKKYYIFNKI